jgi:hypothetical protein
MVAAKAGKEGRRYMRCSTTHRHGKGAYSQPTVRCEELENQLAGYVSGMELPIDYIHEVAAELSRQHRDEESDPEEILRIDRELTRWRRLYALSQIDEATLKTETAPLKIRIASLDRPPVVDVTKAVAILKDVGRLWSEGSFPQKRDFVQEVFSRVVVDGPEISEIRPQANYAPLFVVDRDDRWCRLAPRASVQTPLLQNPKTGKPFAIPELVLPAATRLLLTSPLANG